jgi:hypothetical protein
MSEGVFVKEYALAMIAGMWLADGMALVIAPRFIIEKVRPALALPTTLWPWHWVGVVAGLVLLLAGFELRYQPLWWGVAIGMMGKGMFLASAPHALQERVVQWLLGREDVDYRLWGLSLCTLAVLLLHALGWIGRE